MATEKSNLVSRKARKLVSPFQQNRNAGAGVETCFPHCHLRCFTASGAAQAWRPRPWQGVRRCGPNAAQRFAAGTCGGVSSPRPFGCRFRRRASGAALSKLLSRAILASYSQRVFRPLEMRGLPEIAV